MLTRRRFLKFTMVAGSVAVMSGPTMADESDESVSWHDVDVWPVEGRGWSDQQRLRRFDRFPAIAQRTVPDAVWNLSRHSAGMALRFRTDATDIWVDYDLYSDRLAMPHMPATGVSGTDLYAVTADGSMRWMQVSRPSEQRVQTQLAAKIDAGPRDYMLYLPLYNGVDRLRIGVSKQATVEPLEARKKPIVFYGTSIMHGACASRPGMAIPALVGRRFNRPTINLGFSGNGRMDPPVVDLLAELDPTVYCIDCLPNMNAQLVSERAVPLVERLRKAHPETPIVLVEDRVFTNAVFFQARREFHKDNHTALRLAHQTLVDSGVKNLHYLPADDLLGDDGEAAVDGSHPSDLGFVRYADAYEKVLRKILG